LWAGILYLTHKFAYGGQYSYGGVITLVLYCFGGVLYPDGGHRFRVIPPAQKKGPESRVPAPLALVSSPS
jgi:hypothetical protein